MAILKRKPVSFTDKFEDTLNWVENQPFNFSKYVCELITKDMLKRQNESEEKSITEDVSKQDQCNATIENANATNDTEKKIEEVKNSNTEEGKEDEDMEEDVGFWTE